MIEDGIFGQIGRRIRVLRVYKSMTAKELGVEVNRSGTNICQIETGARKVSIPLLCDIAKALGVEPGAFLDKNFDPEVLCFKKA